MVSRKPKRREVSKKKVYCKLTELIDKALGKFLPKESEEPKIIHIAMRYSVFSGGKRIRPLIVIESSKACGGKLKDSLVAACAVELVHTYSLVHDDLPAMDDDDYRRGLPSLHKAFGEANAILAGDALLTIAFNILSKNLNPKIGMEAIKELSDAIGTKGMVGGQVLDLVAESKKKNKKILDNINCLKTAKLFEVSAKLGAITATAGEKKVDAMAKYGSFLGKAFQVVDDIIDNEGYAKLFGAKKSRDKAEEYIEKAKGYLKIFGNKADELVRVADAILERGV